MQLPLQLVRHLTLSLSVILGFGCWITVSNAQTYPDTNSGAAGAAVAFLDLHGLHVKEACALLVSVLEQRQGGAGATRSSSGGSLTICTGVGKHSDRLLKSGAGSAGGRLEAALERVLRSRGIDFKLVQPGLFKVS